MDIQIYSLIIGIGITLLAFAIVVLILLRVTAGGDGAVFTWIRKNAVYLGLFFALCAMVGSLIYSKGYGMKPCLYCWWQRIFLYPQVVLFAMTLIIAKLRGIADKTVFYYSIPLAIVGIGFSIYHIIIQQGIIQASEKCLASGGVDCTKISVQVFGFLTIPMMALVLGLAILFIGLVAVPKK